MLESLAELLLALLFFSGVGGLLRLLDLERLIDWRGAVFRGLILLVISGSIGLAGGVGRYARVGAG